MIQFVGLNPPRGNFHKQFWIIIFICKEGIERNPNIISFTGYFLVTNSDEFAS